MFSLISKYFKYPKDIVLLCTPRSGSHFYLTEFFSKFTVNNNLDYQVESGEIFNPVVMVWHNPKTHRIWSTEIKKGIELQLYKKKYGYDQLSDDVNERVNQIAYYKKKYNIRLIYSIHPNHLMYTEAPNLIPFLKKQHIFALHRKNKIGQIYSWFRYRNILDDENECKEAAKWMVSEIKNYDFYKNILNPKFEIQYEHLGLSEDIKKYIIKNSPKRLIKETKEKISFYPKLQHEDYKSSPHYFTILRALNENKILNIKENKQRILVMGLPGAGKTSFANKLSEYIKNNSNKTVERINADEVRKLANDFDFSDEGRVKQSIRMFDLSWASEADYVICDFIAPTEGIRKNFSADWTILIDTIKEGRYSDTNAIFEYPVNYDMRVHNFNFEEAVSLIGNSIIQGIKRPGFNKKKETVLCIGDFINWTDDLQDFIETQFSLGKQISIMVRDSSNTTHKNLKFLDIANIINKNLETKYQGMYEIVSGPLVTELKDLSELKEL